METKVPQSIQIEHEELHEQIARAMKAGGRTGEAARSVMKVLQPHMAREEELVAPALALLKPAADGTLTAEMAALLAHVTPLKQELPRMLAEHGRIIDALRDLVRAATEEDQPGFAKLAQMLVAHAQEEEEILYPAAILLEETVKARFGKP
jgi:hemerythrin superfamily protein